LPIAKFSDIVSLDCHFYQSWPMS